MIIRVLWTAYIFEDPLIEVLLDGFEEGIEAVVGASGFILGLILFKQLLQALDREVPWDLVDGADLPQQLLAAAGLLLRPLQEHPHIANVGRGDVGALGEPPAMVYEFADARGHPLPLHIPEEAGDSLCILLVKPRDIVNEAFARFPEGLVARGADEALDVREAVEPTHVLVVQGDLAVRQEVDEAEAHAVNRRTVGHPGGSGHGEAAFSEERHDPVPSIKMRLLIILTTRVSPFHWLSKIRAWTAS